MREVGVRVDPLPFTIEQWEPIRRRLSHLLRIERAVRRIVLRIGEEAPPCSMSFGDFDLMLLGLHALGAFKPPFRKTPPNGMYKLTSSGYSAPIPAFKQKDGTLLAYDFHFIRRPEAFVPVEFPDGAATSTRTH